MSLVVPVIVQLLPLASVLSSYCHDGLGRLFRWINQLVGSICLDRFQVEQRRKEALSQIGDDGALAAEPSLQRLISRYRFLDLWPCSSFDLDHMSRQQVHSYRRS